MVMGRNEKDTSTTFKKPNILVVDNSNIDLRLLVNILNEKDYTVRPMLSGLSALKAVKAQHPDLIILDVRMPEIDGYEVCRRLKSQERFKSVPVIFISASDEVFDKVKAFSMGAVDYITKPYQAEEVLARVKTHLMVYQMKQRLEEQNTRLEDEISERREIEAELKIHRERLEELISKRTKDLKIANENLIGEIRDRKNIEEDLRKSQQLLQGISDNTEAVIYVKDIRGHYMMVNKQFARLLNLEIADIIGKTSGDVLSEDVLDQVDQGHFQVIEMRAPFQKEETYFLGERSHTFISSRFPLMSQENEPYGVAGILFDITDRKKAEEEINRLNLELEKRVIERTSQLRKANLKLKKAMEDSQRMAEKADSANRAKSQFLANMSHEIRTPLNGIIGNTILTLDTPLDTDQKEFLESIHISANHLLEVINDILDFSKIEAGHLDIETVDFNLRTTIESAVESLALKAHEKGLEMNFHLMPDVPEILVGDPLRVRQILFNLGGNAVKFTHKGEITITCKLREDVKGAASLYFSVADTGIGITHEQLNRVFSSFEQADGSITRKFGGTGLGLSITRQLIEKMGGNIWVTSEPEKGSTFHFSLSLDLPENAISETSKIIETQDLKGKSVLIVDGNYTNGKILHQMLSHWGLHGELAENSDKSLALVRANIETGKPYDLILINGTMAKRSGFETGRMMKEIKEFKSAIVILLTSKGLQDKINQSIGSNEFEYLLKPVKMSDLFDIVKRYLLYSSDKGASLEKSLVADSFQVISEENKSLKILLAEDNYINQRMALHMLEKMGHTVCVAEDGEKTVSLFEVEQFDIILMDIQMPLMDGIAATQRIRRMESSQDIHTPIIAMTAHALKGDREKCLAVGMDDYISKPIDPLILSTTLKKWEEPTLSRNHAFNKRSIK